MLAARCAEFPPEVAEGITGVSAADIVAAAKTLWEARPVAFYTWSGLEQHSGATQTIRASNVLYVLTGGLDVPGGSVLFEAVPSNPVDGGSSCPMRALPRWASTSARWARPGSSSSPGKTSAPLPWTDGSRRGELRREHGDGPRGQRPRSRGPARPGFLGPGRPVHDPDSRTCRHRAAGDHPVRIRGTIDRLRNQPGGAVARPAPTAAGRAARRGPLGPADRVRPRDVAGPRRSVLGGRHRSGVPPSACAKRDHPGGAAGSSGGSAGATGHAVPQVRRHRIRNSVAHGGAVLGHAGRARLFTTAGL